MGGIGGMSMERFTHRETPDKHAYVEKGKSLITTGWYSMTNEGYRGPAIERLAAYEDTELEPEAVAQLKQIADIFNCDPNDPAQLKGLLDELRGWQQVGRDGRLVVLPCKVGDMVYHVVHPRTCAPVIAEHRIKTLGEAVSLVGRMGKGVLIDTYLTRQKAEAAVDRLKGGGEHG